MNEIKGNLITLALEGRFDVIAHGCNCFCKQKSGIAKQMVKEFQTDTFPKEHIDLKEVINKLGTIDMEGRIITPNDNVKNLIVVNCYTQYSYGGNHKDGVADPFDPIAIILCMRKLNHEFKGKHIGVPYIGCGLASPEPLRASRKEWFERCLTDTMTDCEVTLVEYDKV